MLELTESGVRADLWLWAARFFKTRTLAKQAILAGRIQVDGAECKPSRVLRVGQIVRVVRGDDCREVAIAALSDRRGPAGVAQGLYRESEQSRVTRLALAEQRRLAASGYASPPTKPDKRARRLIRALGDIDAL
ncbi:MAG: S4 domain-containing protein [Tahibacter sp.]